MDLSNIEQRLFERAKNTSVRAAETAAQRRYPASRVFANIAVGAAALCSTFFVMGSGRVMTEATPPSTVERADQNGATATIRGSGETIRHQAVTRLGEMSV